MNPMVNPDSQKLKGKNVLGWAIVRRVGDNVQRLSVELYKPSKVPEGCEAVPLGDINAMPEAAPARDMTALRNLARRNLAMNVNVPARYVLEQLGEDV